jgi:hypothetical protein
MACDQNRCLNKMANYLLSSRPSQSSVPGMVQLSHHGWRRIPMGILSLMVLTAIALSINARTQTFCGRLPGDRRRIPSMLGLGSQGILWKAFLGVMSTDNNENR